MRRIPHARDGRRSGTTVARLRAAERGSTLAGDRDTGPGAARMGHSRRIRRFVTAIRDRMRFSFADERARARVGRATLAAESVA